MMGESNPTIAPRIDVRHHRLICWETVQVDASKALGRELSNVHVLLPVSKDGDMKRKELSTIVSIASVKS